MIDIRQKIPNFNKLIKLPRMIEKNHPFIRNH